MSVHGMQPQFKDYAGYQEWRSDWRELYAHASSEVRQSKNSIKNLQRELTSSPDNSEETREQLKAMMREHGHKRSIARKLMTALETAKIRWQKIKGMKKGIQEQFKEFPMEVESKNIDFHFNKASMEFDFIPMWVVKAKGKSYYCHSVVSSIGFSTRETPDHPSTKGSIRFKKGILSISSEGHATIT